MESSLVWSVEAEVMVLILGSLSWEALGIQGPDQRVAELGRESDS